MTLPLVVPPAVTGMMFLLMQDGSFGVLSFYLYHLGLASPRRRTRFSANPHTAALIRRCSPPTFGNGRPSWC